MVMSDFITTDQTEYTENLIENFPVFGVLRGKSFKGKENLCY